MSEVKVTKVTNEQEFNAMQRRIDACAITIANPSTSDADRERYKVMYTEFCRLNQRYLRKERILKYPGLRAVYGILEYEFDDPNDDQIESEPGPIEAEPIPEEKSAPAPAELKVDYAAFLDD